MKTDSNRILLLGGYGHVGQRVAHRLADLPLRLAGRSPAAAQAMAASLTANEARPGRVDAIRLDLADPASWDAALDGVGTVLCALDTPDDGFARAVLSRGLALVDISATDAVLRRTEALAPVAHAQGGRALLSVGLAPGLSNLMARLAATGLDRVDRLEIGVLLGAGDTHGAAAIDWTLDTLAPLHKGAIRPVDFGPRAGRVATIPFDFADQHVLRRAGLGAAVTRLGLDMPLAGRTSWRLMAALARHDRGRRLLRWIFTRVRLGAPRTALMVGAQGVTGGDGSAAPVHRKLLLEGKAEAEITAAIAALALRRASALPPGVHHLDDVLTLPEVMFSLAGDFADQGVTLHDSGPVPGPLNG